jgi:hypothetical protein
MISSGWRDQSGKRGKAFLQAGDIGGLSGDGLFKGRQVFRQLHRYAGGFADRIGESGQRVHRGSRRRWRLF